MENNETTDYEKKEETTPPSNCKSIFYANSEDAAKCRQKEIKENHDWRSSLPDNGYPIGYF